MSVIDSFISEVSSDFVDLVEATHDELFQVELRGDTEVQVEMEIVVVSDEGTSSCTSSDSVHHGGFDFEEVARVEEATDVVDGLGSGDEGVSNVAIDQQIEVALTESSLLIFESVVILGEIVEARREQHDLKWKNAQLSLLGGTWKTSHADDVTTTKDSVRGGEGSVVSFIHALVGQDLDLGTFSSEVVEHQVRSRLSLAVDSSSQRDDLIRDAVSGLDVFPSRDELGDGDRRLELVWVDVIASCGFVLSERFQTQLVILARIDNFSLLGFSSLCLCSSGFASLSLLLLLLRLIRHLLRKNTNA